MANRTVSVALKAEIGQFVAGMTKAAAATKGVGESAETSARKSRAGFDLAGKGAMLFGAAAAGALVGVVSKSMEFDKSMSAVQAATRATGAELAALRETAMRAGADTQYSATEAADAITEMAKAGVSAKDIMGGGLNGALALAAAGQMEVADAAELASVAMTQFNLQGSDLPHVADLLAAGAGKAVGSVEDLGQALNQSGLVAAGAGISIEETTGALSAFAAAGLIGSDAGTSFKTMLQRLQAPVGDAAELMGELGISLYDANGQTLGLSEVAGQLHTALADMTPAARDNALAVMFGSDAVRAANALYKEGAAGIENWTNKVNDQGFAAQQAAALNDNLAGDLERLGGSFDTLLITLGEGSQGPLRALAQVLGGIVDGVTGVVEAWNDLPGPVKVAVGALAAAVALRGPLSGLTDTLRSVGETAALRMLMARDAVSGFGAAAATARKGLGGLVGLFGGPWGIALAAAATGISFLTSSMGDSRIVTEATTRAQEGFAEALRASKGALDENVRAAAAKAAQDSGLLDVAEKAGVSLSVVTDALLGQTGAIDTVRAGLRGYIEDNTVFTQSGDYVTTTLNEQGKAGQEALTSFGALSDTVAGTAREQQQLASATASTNATVATAEQRSAAFADQMEQVKGQVDEAKQAVDHYKLSLDILTGKTVSAIEVESALEDALDNATDATKGLDGSVKKANGTLNLHSEAGRAASGVLLDIRDSGNELISTMIEQGKTTSEVTKRDRELRESFIRSAKQMGFSQDEAEKLADKILGIPKERETQIKADTAAAVRGVDNVQNAIDDLHGKTVEVQVRAAGRFIINPSGGLQEFWKGGYTGAGGKYDVKGLVHGDEFVVPKDRVNAMGGPGAVAAAVGMGRDIGAPQDITVLHDTRSLENEMESVANAMKKAQSGIAGGGAIGGGWQSIWNYVKARVPQARINSTYRPGDPGYHGLGKAVDFGYGSVPGGMGSAGLALINRTLHDGVGRNLAELIYDGIGDDRPDLKNGRPLTYSYGTQLEHRNHVHAAVYDQGGPLQPGLTLAYNGTGKTEWVSTERPSPGGGGAGGFGPVVVNARVFVGNREITDIARVEAEAVVGGVLASGNRALSAAGVR